MFHVAPSRTGVFLQRYSSVLRLDLAAHMNKSVLVGWIPFLLSSQFRVYLEADRDPLTQTLSDRSVMTGFLTAYRTTPVRRTHPSSTRSRFSCRKRVKQFIASELSGEM